MCVREAGSLRGARVDARCPDGVCRTPTWSGKQPHAPDGHGGTCDFRARQVTSPPHSRCDVRSPPCGRLRVWRGSRAAVPGRGPRGREPRCPPSVPGRLSQQAGGPGHPRRERGRGGVRSAVAGRGAVSGVYLSVFNRQKENTLSPCSGHKLQTLPVPTTSAIPLSVPPCTTTATSKAGHTAGFHRGRKPDAVRPARGAGGRDPCLGHGSSRD